MHLRSLLAALMAAPLMCALLSGGAAAQERSLYDRLGGYGSIQAVVDQAIANIAADHRINRYFAHADIPRLRHNLADQICAATGGWCIYTGRDMASAHAGMHIRNRDFNALVQDLGMALNKFKVPAHEQHQLVALLAPLKPEIVGH